MRRSGLGRLTSMRSYLNETELESLQGLQHEARTLYREGLRPYMDFATGLVGYKRRVSYQMFRELLEVVPDVGSRDGGTYQPSKGRMRNLLLILERRGLVVKQKQPQKTDPMVFKLPLADCGVLVRAGEQRHRSDIGETTQANSVGVHRENQQLRHVMALSIVDNEPRSSIGATYQQQHTSVKSTTAANTNNITREISGNGFCEAKITADWYPHVKTKTLLAEEGIHVQFIDDYRDEFVLYWLGDGASKKSWDAVFVRQCRDWWRKTGGAWRPGY